MSNIPKHQPVVDVDQSAVGVGKTHSAICDAVTRPGRYLFVVERRGSITEIEKRINQMARLCVPVVTIMSDEATRGFSVRQEVEALPERYPEGHLIAVCSHQAMMMSDLSAFAGWRIVIDETPGVLTQGEVESKCDRAFFQAHYTLTPIDQEWSSVKLTEAGAALTGSDLHQDDSHRHLRLFHQRVTAATNDNSPDSRRAVICNLPDWSVMESGNVKWTWWSLFSLRQLEAFDSILILANGFMGSVGAKMLQAWDDDIVWNVRCSNGTRELVHRKVAIRYFSYRRSSLNFFESPTGQAHLASIGDHIRSNVDAARFIWSANDKARDALALPQASYLTPRQAGTDRFMHCTEAAMIYAAKPNQNVRAVLRAFGIDPACWVSTNEYETVLQFVTRTSLRDVASAAPVTIYVYDRDQADYLMEFLDRQPHVTAECEFIDLNLQYPERSKGGRPREVLTFDEAREKEKARNRARAEQQRIRRARAKAA